MPGIEQVPLLLPRQGLHLSFLFLLNIWQKKQDDIDSAGSEAKWPASNLALLLTSCVTLGDLSSWCLSFFS